jgi:branched-chain amino acid transport system permease protein
MILVVGLSAALAGIAAAFLAPILYVSYYGGVSMMLKGFIAATIGGLGSIAGAMVGGLLLGLAESAVGVYLSSGWRDAIIYASLIGLLAYLPNGLFGRR